MLPFYGLIRLILVNIRSVEFAQASQYVFHIEIEIAQSLMDPWLYPHRVSGLGQHPDQTHCFRPPRARCWFTHGSSALVRNGSMVLPRSQGVLITHRLVV